MKKQTKYICIRIARVVEINDTKNIELKVIEVTSDFADFLNSEYQKQFGKHAEFYLCCWINDMILKYAAFCGLYRLPKNTKK